MSLSVSFIGPLIHKEFPEKNYRIILGKEISDFKRNAYTLPFDRVHLSPIKGISSGEIGFLDYSKREYPDHFSHYISFFGIEPEHRNKGYGRRTIELFLDFSKKQGAKYIRANIESFREDRIKNFFMNIGFEDMGFPIEKTYDCYRLIYSF